MGIFCRISAMVSGSVNDLLDKADNPETAVNQLIRDMEQAIAEMRKTTASALANCKMTEKKLERNRQDKETWYHNAELAVQDGNDDLARKALERKKVVSARVGALEIQLKEENELVEKLKQELQPLEDKIQEARAKRDTLITKKRAAANRQQMANSASKSDSKASSIINGFSAFEKMEEHIEKHTAELDAQQQLADEANGLDTEREFQKMKEGSDTDDELEALKKELGK